MSFNDSNLDDPYGNTCFSFTTDSFVSAWDLSITDNDYDTYADNRASLSDVCETDPVSAQFHFDNTSIKTIRGFSLNNNSYISMASSSVNCFFTAIDVQEYSNCFIKDSTIQSEEVVTLSINGGANNSLQNSVVSSSRGNAISIATGTHPGSTRLSLDLCTLSGGTNPQGDPMQAIFASSIEELQDHIYIYESQWYNYSFSSLSDLSTANYINIRLKIEAEWWHTIARWTPYYIDDVTEASNYKISLFYSSDDEYTATPIQEVIVDNCEYDFTSYFISIEPNGKGYKFTVMPLDSSSQPLFASAITSQNEFYYEGNIPQPEEITLTFYNPIASWSSYPEATEYIVSLWSLSEQTNIMSDTTSNTYYDFSSIIEEYGDGEYYFELIPLGEGQTILYAPPYPFTSPTYSTLGVNGFVERLYTVALNRVSEEEGKANWINALVNHQETGGSVARFFCLSQEMINRNLSNEDYVTMLYHLFFDRAPDQGGFNDWVGRLSHGASRESILEGFINSIEWANVCTRYGIDSGGTALSDIPASEQAFAFVERLFSKCLGRAGDETGLNDWAWLITNRRQTATEVAYGFFFSPEFINANHSDEVFVDRLYETFVDRPADPMGKADWIGRLESGATREEVFMGFANSPEFQSICESYGIYN